RGRARPRRRAGPPGEADGRDRSRLGERRCESRRRGVPLEGAGGCGREGATEGGGAERGGGDARRADRGARLNLPAALRDLDARQPEVMPGPSLDRIRALVELLDHPELTYPSVHVTGTNGKTTTARLISAVACAHGLSTGTYLSPHLQTVTER